MSQFRPNIALLVLLVAMAAIGVVGCGQKVPRSSDVKSEIRIALQSDIRGTNPGVNRDVFTDDVLLQIVETLVTYADDLSVVPLLAERVERSQDGTRYIFHLRRDVVFHNGAPMTSREVVWSWERMLDPATNWVCRVWFDGSQGLKIESVTATDLYTVEFVINRPSVAFLDLLSNLQCSPVILHPDSVASNGDWIAPVGTGPFKLDEWMRGEYVLLIRHDAYRIGIGERNGLAGNKEPAGEVFRGVIIPDPSAAKAALLSGQVDIATRLQVSDLVDIEAATNLTVFKRESLDWNVLLMQSARPPFDDRLLRQAVAHAIDFSILAEVVSGDVSQPNASIVARSSSEHISCHQDRYVHDIEKAKDLLSRSGYEGEPIKLITNKRFANMFDNALIIQRMLIEIGLNVELEVLEWTTQIDQYYSGDFDLMSFGYTGRTEPSLGYKAILGPKSENAFYQWDSAEAMALLNQTETELDPGNRRSMFCRLHAMMLDEAPLINLYNNYIIEAASDRVIGYDAHATQKPRLWGVSLSTAEGEGGE